MDYEILEESSLSDFDKQAMFKLMVENYSGVKKADFLRDLSKKDYVIILKSVGQLCGFSTFALFEHEINGERIRVAFSGDTVINKENRNSRQLPVSFGMLMNRIEKMSDEPLYWMLISKGFRTYRFLPVYFKEFYPAYNQCLPEFEKQLMMQLGEKLFGERYKLSSGIVSSSGQAVKSVEEDLHSIELREDLHIQYFNDKNPNWHNGDELVCLVKYSRSNLNSFIVKILDKKEQVLAL